MINSIQDRVQLNNGVQMPWLGLGVWLVRDEVELDNAIKAAIRTGYRAIDTAAAYYNEEGVGKAIRESDVPREELFITTKVWNVEEDYDTTLKNFEDSRKKLGLEYIDLYLIHWPGKRRYTETWRALEALYKQGLVRAIGVSNFEPHHLTRVLETGSIVPMVNQVEYHPLLTQKELHAFCKKHKIQLQAWSPLMRGRLDLPLLLELSKKYGKTPAQIVLRWDLQNEVVTIPKSVREHRIAENAQIFDFELSQDDMALIDGLNQNERFGADPDVFDFRRGE
jgi:diketogulonate reductase-like aldo/keto reductase